MPSLATKRLCLCTTLAVLLATLSANATTMVVNIGEFGSAQAAGRNPGDTALTANRSFPSLGPSRPRISL